MASTSQHKFLTSTTNTGAESDPAHSVPAPSPAPPSSCNDLATSPQISSRKETEPRRAFLNARLHRLTRSDSGERRSYRRSPMRHETVESKLARLLREYRRCGRQKPLFIGASIGLAALIFLVTLKAKEASFLFFLATCLPICLLLLGVKAFQDQKRKAAELTQFEEVQAIGPLVEATGYAKDPIARAAEQALVRLLPRLQASDDAVLNTGQRACLNRALRGRNTPLALAILKAWEQVGDTDAIPAVRALAEGHAEDERILKEALGEQTPASSTQSAWTAWTRNRFRLRLIAPPLSQITLVERRQRMLAAQDCLPALLQRVERRKIELELLRPTNFDPASPTALLRPSASLASQEPQQQLLRPTDKGSS